jgi:hypothetical protein
MFLIWTFGCGGCGILGWVAPSRIQSSRRVISFHWIALGTIVFDQDRSVWRSSVSPFRDWYLCLLAKAENIAL